MSVSARDENDRLVAGTLPYDPDEGTEPMAGPPSANRPSETRVKVEPPTPAERVRALAALGPVIRLPTGIETLDESCRGGIPTRRLVVLGGAPGAGKTSLATYLGWRWLKMGIPVAFLAIDEGPEGVLMRIAQLECLGAENVEERDPATLARLEAIVGAMPMVLADADDAHGTVEGAAELLSRFDPSKPRVLIVDSIQTATASGSEAADSPRERVDAVVRALKRVRDQHGFLIIATCELARGAYRSRNVAEAINDLAAFKESGSVEYAAQTAMVLRSVPDESDLVDVSVPKNRAYKKEPFRLRLDHRTTSFEEVIIPPSEAAAGRPRKVASSVEADAHVIFRVLLDAAPIHGRHAIRQQVRARAITMSQDRIGAAITWLENRGAMVNRPEGNKPRFYADVEAFNRGTEANQETVEGKAANDYN